MGTYVQLLQADWRIPETEEVLAKLKEMPRKFHGLKRGGSSNGGSWFSWMSDASILGAESVKEVFELLGFTVNSDDPNFVDLVEYDNKTGQEDLFLAVVAPFVAEGSYMDWRVEDDSLYRFTVVNNAMHVGDGQPFALKAELFRPVKYESGFDDKGKWYFRVITFDSIDDPAIANHLTYYDDLLASRLKVESEVLASAEKIVDEALAQAVEGSVEAKESVVEDSLPID